MTGSSGGGDFIEFDVQVTSDNVPILFHDDWIEWGASESFRSERIADMSLADLKRLSSSDGSYSSITRRTRESDLTWTETRGAWHCAVDDEFPTLAELFEALPSETAFNLEVKMTTGLGITPEAEVNRVVNPILAAVEKYAGGRTVVFSSFDPDVCIAVRERQNTHEVLFLTACHEPHPDTRQRSVEAAVEVAKKHNLRGVVVDTEKLRENPNLITAVKLSGLYLASYGRSNDVAEWVSQQVALGVDAVIADDISGALSVATQPAALVVDVITADDVSGALSAATGCVPVIDFPATILELVGLSDPAAAANQSLFVQA
eukprot:CAMPEP_0117678352 /NCGR_PEP_ID=MMETSP0804-20121206/17249_1 /TAXON_ID=1074897 /ORGANISM="Tetraselmis astigmatica, Strain CCMP880" /LENGTH=317 /DNA_ID=CAMNT_0005487729 /DNA_START=327 /DNA_END=1281 /DNA_ORIENTATION=+